MLLELSSKQKAALEAGQSQRKHLIFATQQAALSTELDNPEHYYIYGPSGIGKTFQSEKAVDDMNVITRTVSGNVSMFAFAIQLAVIKYLHPDEKVVIIIDDCDEILKDAKTINQMKELLGKNILSYNKRFHVNSVGEEGSLEHTAISSFMREGQLGFSVDVSNFTFIITSNIQLPYDDTADKMVEKNGGLDSARSIRARHLAAIRGRVMPVDLNMTWQEKWGNLAYVLLEDNLCDDCTKEQKLTILHYLWDNWKNMKETSIRTAEKMSRMLHRAKADDNIRDMFDFMFLK
jgi:hypothetical protein